MKEKLKLYYQYYIYVVNDVSNEKYYRFVRSFIKKFSNTIIKETFELREKKN